MPFTPRIPVSGVRRVLSEVLEGVFQKAVPPKAGRGPKGKLTETPEILARAIDQSGQVLQERQGVAPGSRIAGRDVPFLGPEEARLATRTTADPSTMKTLGEKVDDLKVFFAGLSRSEPGLPTSLGVPKGGFVAKGKSMTRVGHTLESGGLETGDMFAELRSMIRGLRDGVEVRMADEILAPLKAGIGTAARKTGSAQREVFGKVRQLSDYMVWADRAAELAANQKKTTIDGFTEEKVLEALRKTAVVLEDSSIRETHSNLRAVADSYFDAAVERGWIHPDRYRDAYSPLRRLAMVLDASNEHRGATPLGADELQQFMRRGMDSGGGRETDIVTLWTNYMVSTERRIAEEEVFSHILRDDTLNLTKHFADGDIPVAMRSKVRWYKPKPGQVGYVNKEVDHAMLDGVLDALPTASFADDSRGFAMPRRVVDALEGFNPRIPGENESMFYGLGRNYASAFTVYNPAVTMLNLLSDTPLAFIGGLPNEPARPLGFLRLGDSLKSAFNGVVRGVRDERFTRALENRIATSTHTFDLGGRPASTTLREFQEVPSFVDKLKKFTQGDVKAGGEIAGEGLGLVAKARQVVELMPKIAAGEEALARTGSIKEYGRVGRNITLDFAKAPQATRDPAFRFAAPFYAFFGSISPRVAQLSTRKGSRNRMLAAIAAVPVSVALWNYHDEDYRRVEHSLNAFERDQLHWIVPGADGKPMVDDTGKPVVKRIRYFLPEEIAKIVGLGNMPSRIARVINRRDTVQDMFESIGKGAVQGVTGQILPARLVAELSTGRSLSTGEDVDPMQSFIGGFPQARAIEKGILNVRTEGAVEGTLKTLEENILGFSEASVRRRGKGLFDVDLMDAKRAVQEHRRKMVKAYGNGETAKGDDEFKKMKEAVIVLQRVAKAVQAEQGELPNTTPEEPGRE